MQQIYDYGKKHLHLQAMLYCSDHGEDMHYSHTVAHFTYDMTHIPFFLYLSPAYRTRFPEVDRTLKNNQTRIFTNDLIFELLSGLLQAPNNYYESQYDISSATYALTPETAQTMHGDKRITTTQTGKRNKNRTDTGLCIENDYFFSIPYPLTEKHFEEHFENAFATIPPMEKATRFQTPHFSKSPNKGLHHIQEQTMRMLFFDSFPPSLSLL